MVFLYLNMWNNLKDHWNNLPDINKVKIIIGIITLIGLAYIQIFRDYL